MMKCTNENFRNVVCLLRYWPRGDVRGMVAWTTTKTYLRGRGIEGKPKWEKAVFAVLSCLKRFCGTKRLLGYILFRLKRLFGTKLYGLHQSGPENGVNNRPFCHRFINMEKTV